ncbi:tyrosine phosphatase-like protein [Hyaloraphidium curvatum]|nr:tyrosine phosphatase-like protein [Hyaloraphidium curvatum]
MAATQKKGRRRQSSPPRAQSSPAVNAYLVAYNVASFLGWGYVLVKTVRHYANGGSPADVYAQTGELTKWVQTGALLEIVHSAVGFVRSPVGTTATQVFSRIMLVWGVMHLFPYPDVVNILPYTTMTVAWSITEVVRYSFYAAGLLGGVPAFLNWMRYTFFYFLYPLGAGSEMVLLFKSLPYAKKYSTLLYLFDIFLLAIYPPVFLQLYTYMMGQRKKALSKK